MSRKFRFNSDLDTPVVAVRLRGKERESFARLVFDTGAAVTQINTMVIEALGFSARDSKAIVSAHGPAGPIQDGYLIELAELEVLGVKFKDPIVAVYDFDHLEGLGIDGLLGFDLIKQFHLEMNGPEGELVVY